ncbi:histidine kinase dimerization/phosphoacceptor domain -containing protein [Desulfopila aestuarii]|uniref:histidine kinase n=1 Tax=Desulfopila aestuarii DSM 18488 TaxID=1121416 RepID=A0A1M7XZH9_9BACT|nr:histidine kinase dimerization/phosphoacceptor domain -containing protein [Desulfopila aestuarii]SHO44554.1 PAS domain S-box-containing protein [Desulfopila aestuarii DSM 18488]
MMELLKTRIGVKLFVLLAVLIILVMIPFCYMVFSTLSGFGNYAADFHRDEARQRAYSYLSTIAREKAHKYDASFSQAETAVSLMAAQSREVFSNIDYFSALPSNLHDSVLQLQYGIPLYREQDVSTVFRGEGRAVDGKQRELLAMMQLDPVLKGVQENVRGSVSTHLITASGICRYLRHNMQAPDGMNVQDRNPLRYRAIMESLKGLQDHQQIANVSAVWTPVYNDIATGVPIITVLSPVVGKDGAMQGAVGVDISLAGGLDWLDDDIVQSKNWSGETLFSFLIAENGEIISFPKKFLGLFGLPGVGPKTGSGETGGQISLADSRHKELAASAPKLIGSVAETAEVTLGADGYVLNMHTLHRLNWHLVLVSEEAQFTAAVQHTEQALSGTMHLLAKRFVVYGVILLFITLVVVYWAVIYFVSPLKRMSVTAQRVGQGDLQVRCKMDRADELGILARSFNAMVDQLQEAERLKQTESRQLELTVQARTRDLRNKNIVLRDVIQELNRESERRRNAVYALRKSEEQIHIVMDASVAGHGIIQDKKIRYVNPMASRIFGYSREEMTRGDISVLDLVMPGQFERINQMSILHFQENAEKPFICECRRKDGTAFEALVGGAVTSWNDRPALVATIMDISDQKQTEEELLRSKLMLQESLAEKEVLLREIYHRTKNNMLVIISMLQLQAMELEDQQVKMLFWETESRIRAMSLVHEKLYQSQNLTDIDLGQYLEEMVSALVASMVFDDAVKVDFDCQQVFLSIDSVVPLGLAINEIVTNSLKHAFPKGAGGCIYIRLRRDSEGLVEVVVGDNGPGLPKGLEPRKARSLGMQITTNLITGQLHGSLEITSEAGVCYRIRFTEPARPKRV